MSSLVSDFIINPVLRQARRFSEISRSTIAGDGNDAPASAPSAVSDNTSAAHCSAIEPDAEAAPVVTEACLTRPVSASTQETSIDEAQPTSPVMPEESVSRDHIGLALNPLSSRRIPEDDGMRELRGRIHAINARDIPPSDKAKLIHEVLLEGYRASRTEPLPAKLPDRHEAPGPTQEQSPLPNPLKFLQQHLGDALGDASTAEKLVVTEEDAKPTFVPIKLPKNQDMDGSRMSELHLEADQPLGCQHYERNVKLQCSTCKKWYTCRFCHDSNEDHNLVRPETRNMLCMLCATPQKASDVCINCGQTAAHYYCNICKLWENRQSKPIYHCNDCGICRRGLGLGKDFFHCKTCRACISTSIESSHKCIERSTDCDCPICGEYMFTSPRPVVFMACGHSIHKKCYDQHMKVSYKCPICNKSLANMESQFRNLDVAIQSQPMPPEFRDTTAVILCNDCSGKSTVRYHWLGLKCSICRSYNTVELNILAGDQRQVQPPIPEEAPLPADTIEIQTRGANSIAGRPAQSVPNRRRHSSHGLEAQYRPPDRIARSVSPMNMGFDSIMAFLPPDGESDDNDMLGLWRRRGHIDDSGSDQEDSGSDDVSAEGSEAEEEDEEDDNEIVLFGHR